MPDNKPSPPEDDRPKKFRITRKRLGTIRFVDPKGEYGFIEAEDFREDVFFHHSAWQAVPVAADGSSQGPLSERPGGPPQRRDQEGRGREGRQQGRDREPAFQRPQKLNPELLVTKHVEFEIDDELFETEQRLRATVVRPTRRPMGRKLTGRDATFKIVTHHPKARRKRPDWRGE